MGEKGLYIAMEGIDGCGKSTQIARLRDRLLELGIAVALFHEPGSHPVAERIRTLIARSDEPIQWLAELSLMNAARICMLPEVERERQSGTIAVADRTYLSSICYQGYGNGLSPAEMDEVRRQCDVAVGLVVPDHTIVFDVPVEVTRERLARKGKLEYMERKGDAFFRRVRSGYQAEARAKPEHITLLDGTDTPEIVAGHVWRCVEHLLRTRS